MSQNDGELQQAIQPNYRSQQHLLSIQNSCYVLCLQSSHHFILIENRIKHGMCHTAVQVHVRLFYFEHAKERLEKPSPTKREDQ
jgi:hypothetical protein